MKKRTFWLFGSLLIFSFLLVINLGKINKFYSASFAQSNQSIDLTVSAAASLQDALEAIASNIKFA
jgi:molybdate transport system substrate-binding protein